MNLITKTKQSNGFFRIFNDQWDEEMKQSLREATQTGEIDYIELPFAWGSLRYTFLREHQASELSTVMFKIPMNLIPYEELWSKWGKRKQKQLAEFLMAWIIRDRVELSELKKRHSHYTFCYATVSVPRFLKSRLFAHLKAFGITFKEVSPEYNYVSCQNCKFDFRFKSMTTVKKHQCPNCGAVSFVR